MNLKSQKMKEYGKDIILILIGSFTLSIAINIFIVNANLLSGGVSGIALIIQYLFNIPAGYTMLLLNIPLLIMSWKKLDSKFTIYTVIGTLSLSAFLILTGSLKDILKLNDVLLLCIYGGVLMGIGSGIVFSNHGSTGGLDIISVIVKKKYENFNIGTISFSVNIVIVSIGAIFFGLSTALYTLVSMYIGSYVMDKVIKGFGRKKLILIITCKEEKVSNEIMNNLGRGVTFLYGEGAYTKVQKKILYCIVSLSQLPQLKQLVREIDEDAFISIMDASDVEGKGFPKLI